MPNFIRSLCITISTALFHFIPKVYQLFYDLAANHELFSPETIDTFSRNMYVLVSVVMLFAFAVKAIESIINPDMLIDSKKGYVSVIKRSAIALLLIVGIPFAFRLFYDVQDEIMAKSLIEKIIIGVSIDNNGTGDENPVKKSGAGNMLASTALKAVLYPAGEDTCVQYEDSDVCSNYNAAMDDIDKMGRLIPDINEKVEGEDGEEDYVLTYEGYGIVSILVGAVVLYMLVLFCIDTALRLVKMGFLEITAPISVIAYIFGGNDILKNWFKEVKATAFSLFGRVAALALMIFVLSKLPEFVENDFPEYGKLISIFIIIAVLMFVKEAPNYIEKIFGVKVGGKGGIAGRLGSMAGVGNIAKSAWEKVRTAGIAVGGAALGGIGLAGAVIGAPIATGLTLGGATGLGFAGKKISDALKTTDLGQKFKRFGQMASSFVSSGNPIKGAKEAVKTYKDSPYTAAQRTMKSEAKAQKFADDIGLDYNTGRVKGSDDDKKKVATAFNKLNGKIDKDNLVSKNAKNAVKNKISADKTKQTLEKAKSHNDAIVDTIDSAITNAKDPNAIRRLSNLKSQYLGGNISFDDMASSIKSMAGRELTEGETNKIIGKLNSLNNMADNDAIIKSLINDGGGLSAVALSKAISSASQRADTAEKVYKAQYDAADIKSKEELDIITSSAKLLTSEYVNEVGTSDKNKYEKVSYGNGTQSTSGNSGSSQSSQQNSGGSNNSGRLSPQEEQELSNLRDYFDNTSNEDAYMNPQQYQANLDRMQELENARNSTVQNNPERLSPQEEQELSNLRDYFNNTSNEDAYMNPQQYQANLDRMQELENARNLTVQNNSGNENGSGGSNNSESGNNSQQDLSGFFAGLSKDIKDANDATNSILNEQLKTQQSTLDESKKQNSTLNNISTGVNNINNNVSQMNQNIRNFANQNDRNLKDIGQKLDDIDGDINNDNK